MLDSMVGSCEAQEPKSLVCADDSIRSRLIRNKQRYETQLNTVNQALAALDENPKLANLLELIRKAS